MQYHKNKAGKKGRVGLNNIVTWFGVIKLVCIFILLEMFLYSFYEAYIAGPVSSCLPIENWIFLTGPRKWWWDVWRHKWHQVVILNSRTYCIFITKSLLTKLFHLAQRSDSTVVPARHCCVHSFHLEKVQLFTDSFLLRSAMPWAGKTPAIKSCDYYDQDNKSLISDLRNMSESLFGITA